jgi:hypothetical protein
MGEFTRLIFIYKENILKCLEHNKFIFGDKTIFKMEI